MTKNSEKPVAPEKAKTKNTRIIPAFLILLAVVGLFAVAAFEEPPYNNIENDQLQLMLDSDTPIYDVRRADEWKQTGVIKGSHLLTFVDGGGRVKPDFLPRFTAEVGKHDPVILICRTGNRTSTLARYLVEELGYTNVFNVDDGISRWIREKRPVEKAGAYASETAHSRGVI